MTIPKKQSEDLDLHALRVLDVLFRERSLTRAAEALHTQQPAQMGSDRAAHAIEDQRAVEPNPLQSDQTTPTVEPTPEPTPSPTTTSHALLCNVNVAFMICRTLERRARR